MADNVAVTEGSGVSIAADEIASVKYQRVKLIQGADGVNDGDVSSAAPLQVTLANTGANATPVVVDLGANNDVTVTSGSITATQATGTNLHTVVDSGTITTVSTVTSVTAIGTSVTPGTSAAHLGKAVDAVAGASDTGVLALAVRDDTLATLTPADGDYTQLRVTSTGQLHVGGTVLSAIQTAVEGSLTVDNAGTFAVQDADVLAAIEGTVAHDAADSGNGSKISGVASTTPRTAVSAAGDRVDAWFNLNGAQAVTPQPNAGGGLTVFRSLDLDESEEEVKATAGCLYKLRISNFATSARYVKIYNATAANVTVGTTTPVDTIPVPPASAAGNPTVITESYGGQGLGMDTAICLAATTALADADTGAPAANDVVVSAYYK
jgi:hypothetical protein